MLWRSHHSLQQGRNGAIRTCGWQDFVFFYSFHIHPQCVSWLLCQSGERHSGTSEDWRAANITTPLHICSLFLLSLPISFPLSVICSLASSFSLINSLIKDTTSKSQLQGLCLHSDRKRWKKQTWHRFPLLLLHSLPPPHPQLLPTLGHLYHRQ